MARVGESLWTDERVALLTKRWGEGSSYGEITGELACGLSRSAVIGKADRLGLPKRGKIVLATPRHKPVRRMTMKAKEAAGIAPRHVMDEPVETPAVDDVDVTGLVALVDLQPHSCRWPVAGEGAKTMFCGQHAHHGPYCPDHSKRAGLGYGKGARP